MSQPATRKDELAMDSNVQKRLQDAIDALCGGNKSEFCRRIGKDVSSLKDIIGEKHSYPGYGLLYAILSSDLGISPKWLMLGEGDMLSENSPKEFPTYRGLNVKNVQAVFVTNWEDIRAVVEDAVKKTLLSE